MEDPLWSDRTGHYVGAGLVPARLMGDHKGQPYESDRIAAWKRLLRCGIL